MPSSQSLLVLLWVFLHLTAQLVTDFKCLHRADKTDCSWIPRDPAVNLTLSYRWGKMYKGWVNIKQTTHLDRVPWCPTPSPPPLRPFSGRRRICGTSAETRQRLRECKRSYHHRGRDGCYLSPDFVFQDACVLLRSDASMRTFKPQGGLFRIHSADVKSTRWELCWRRWLSFPQRLTPQSCALALKVTRWTWAGPPRRCPRTAVGPTSCATANAMNARYFYWEFNPFMHHCNKRCPWEGKKNKTCYIFISDFVHLFAAQKCERFIPHGETRQIAYDRRCGYELRSRVTSGSYCRKVQSDFSAVVVHGKETSATCKSD